MFFRSPVFLMLCFSSVCSQAQNPLSTPIGSATNQQEVARVPAGAILVKGAWSSTSDDETPPPEASRIEEGVFLSPYFGISYSLLDKWAQGFQGPPPSEDGRYVLAEMNSAGKEKVLQHVLITAEDLFFTRLPIDGAAALIDYRRDHLQAEYRVEYPVTNMTLAGHPFWILAYESPVAHLHWYVLATDLRCHVVNFIFTSHAMLQPAELAREMKSMELPMESPDRFGEPIHESPVCIKNYAGNQHLLIHVEPSLSRQMFNTIPVRILIDQDGHVAHIHILSAFSDQSKAIIEALGRWRFKPYLIDGHAVEVETGLVFGLPVRQTAAPIRRYQ
jgi:Gram-negative bacterial TonB protein C-terminal